MVFRVSSPVEAVVNRKKLLVVAFALVASSAGAADAPRRGTSDTDKLEASANSLARMKTSMKQVLGRVEEARNEKDVVKLNCVNEKLTQIKALLKVAEQADIALHEAVSNKDPAAESEFAKIAIARSKVEGLRADSEQCIGQLAYIVDEKTTVEVQQPSNLPGDSSSDEVRERRRGLGPPFSVPPVIRPPPASRWY
ncbi:MAG TPA: hypothetical protein VIV57_01440 [Anaeromyxobacter sp.]